MIEWLTEKLMAWCERTGRVLKITGSGGPDDIYLIRYYVVKSKWFNVFIHQFLRSDRDDMHDHPWSFLTYLVRGAYTETKWNAEKNCEEITRRQAPWTGVGPHRPGHLWPRNRLVFRHARDQHKVQVDQSSRISNTDEAPLTICVTGPTVREWGFVRAGLQKVGNGTFDGIPATVYRQAGRQWIPWREYLGLPPDEPGRG